MKTTPRLRFLLPLYGASLLALNTAPGAQCELETERIEPTEAAPGAAFGFRVSISGDLAVVGAVDDDASGENSGSAWIYTRDPVRGWEQCAQLTASDGAAGDSFGWAVDIEGEHIAIGAPFADGRGAVYVFTRESDTWVETVKLVPSGTSPGALFGHALALDEKRLLVGAPHTSLGVPGAAHLFESEGSGVWRQVQRFAPSEPDFTFLFGYEVALEGDTALITGSTNAFSPLENAIYVYVREAHGMMDYLEAGPIIPPIQGGTYFASDIAFDGELLLATAPGEYNFPGMLASVYVFARDRRVGSKPFVQRKRLESSLAPHGLFFPEAVALSGEWLVAGDPYSGNDAGAVYVFGRNVGGPDAFGEVARLRASDVHAGGYFGFEVALDGDVLLAGSPEEFNAGIAPGAGYFLDLSHLGRSSWRNDAQESNPSVYSATAPILGSTFVGTVHLEPTRHVAAFLFASPAPAEVALPNGAVLLCDLTRGFSTTSVEPGPLARFEIPIPQDPLFCGMTLATQAALLDEEGGFALSNAQDLAFGIR
ncbi:MAG: hypothetical protein CMJ89_09250 [Planctomycetes bacterium]|jgi:hypothetical protein|nr:hypothetical protein [Planctomycetota bacterium]